MVIGHSFHSLMFGISLIKVIFTLLIISKIFVSSLHLLLLLSAVSNFLLIADFTGCLTRLQVGIAFPLKDPLSSRLSYRGGIRFESCPYKHM